MLTVRLIPTLTDNYVFWLHDAASGENAIVDPGETAPVLAALGGQKLDWILCTHHHHDHTGGVTELVRATGARVAGAARDASRLPRLDRALKEGERFCLGQSEAEIWEVDGHTRGHIAYVFGESGDLFCGDTLFLLGCGRLFEGSADEMWSSLSRLMSLPDTTRVWCAHEYTLANGRFAREVEPGNADLLARLKRDESRRARGEPTVPGTMGEERATNPFLRAGSIERFAALRKQKDSFR